VNGKIPFFTIRNTHNKFAWLTNFLETYLSAQLWKSATIATITYEYRKLANQFALLTTGTNDGTEYQIHDFCFRGMSGWTDSMTAGAGFALSSRGSDNIPAIYYLEQYYGADCTKEFIMTSVPASEHSIACLGIAVDGELATYRKWITVDYPTGIVSIIADTVDFFRVVTEYAAALRDEILARKVNEHGIAKVVFRPDSGDPADIICGTAIQVDALPDYRLTDIHPGAVYRYKELYWQVEKDENGHPIDWVNVVATPEQKGAVECLWDIFGGTITEQGYRVLHERVGLIYGDSITLSRALEIFTRLKAKGYASTNVVLGVGSYTCQYLTRDSAGMAVKATAAQVNGEWFELFKAPKTDNGTKKSAKGLLRIEEVDGSYVLHDQQTPEQESQGCLQLVYEDGQFHNLTTLSEIRSRLWGN
jgi:nicotinamide phosphoribosyltransferase